MGDNEFGQVGVKRDESVEKAIVELPTQITAFSGIKLKQIACGDEFSVALTSNGEVFTWGRGQYGQLGLGKDQVGPLEKPTKVTSLPSIKKIFAGPNQVFAIEFTDGMCASLLIFNYVPDGLMIHMNYRKASSSSPCH